MLAPEFRVQGFEPDDWLRLLELLSEYAGAGPGPGARRGVIAITSRDQLVQLWRVQHGGLPTEGVAWPLTVQQLAHHFDAPWAATVQASALSELNERFAAHVIATDGLQDQWVRILVVLQELFNEGAISIWPRNLFNWPALVREHLVRSSVELLCPPGKCLILGVFDKGELYTALVVQRGETEIEALIGPRELAGPMGLLSGDWLRDYPHLIRAVETQYCPVAGGCFAQRTTLERLLRNQVPGAFSQAVMARDVVLHPVNPALAVTLGMDLGYAALASMKSLTRRLRDSPFAKPSAWQKIRSAARSDSGLEELLKLDPLAVIGRLIVDRKTD